MEDFKQNQKVRFDPKDPWDGYLVTEARKEVIENGFQENYDPDDFDQLLDYAEMISAGVEYDDGFNSWNYEGGQVIVSKPDYIFTPHEVNKILNNEQPIRLQYLAIGQPDGPGTSGIIWTSRLWDEVKRKEIPNSRYMADKLSWAISSSIATLNKSYL